MLSKETWLDVSKKLDVCQADMNTWVNDKMLKLKKIKMDLIIFNQKHNNMMITEEVHLQIGE